MLHYWATKASVWLRFSYVVKSEMVEAPFSDVEPCECFNFEAESVYCPVESGPVRLAGAFEQGCTLLIQCNFKKNLPLL